MKKIKIITNTIPLLSPMTGVGNYVYSLLTRFKEMRPDYSYAYYCGYFTKKLRFYEHHKNFYRAKNAVKKVPVLSKIARKIYRKMASLQLSDYDLYFEPNFVPLDIRSRRVVTTVYDFSFHHHPEWHPKDRVEFFRVNFFKRIGRSDIIITISDHVRNEALDLLKFDKDRIITIHLGSDPVFSSNGDKPDTPKEGFILFVGSIEPRKNLIGLLRAYMMLPEDIRKEYKLLLAGFKGWENAEIVEMLKKMKGRVDYLGYVDNETLAGLYKKAACFVYPSLYEGFGLPPLEAMACGCPVVVSNVASLPEVCGNAALYVDPHSIENIAEGMHKMLKDESLRKSLIKKGFERARLFSWDKAAREHLKVFEEVLKS